MIMMCTRGLFKHKQLKVYNEILGEQKLMREVVFFLKERTPHQLFLHNHAIDVPRRLMRLPLRSQPQSENTPTSFFLLGWKQLL